MVLLSALVDLFMEHLVFDISVDIKELQKCYELSHHPAVEVKQKSETIDDTNYVIRKDRNAIVTYQKYGNDEVYHVDFLNGTCSCRYFKETEGRSKGCITSIVGNVNGTATYLFVRCFCKHIKDYLVVLINKFM